MGAPVFKCICQILQIARSLFRRATLLGNRRRHAHCTCQALGHKGGLVAFATTRHIVCRQHHMATSCERRVDHCGHELAQALGANGMPAAHAKRQPRLEKRRFGTFKQMAPAAIRKLIECNEHKGLIGIGSIQVQAFCNLVLPQRPVHPQA